MITIAYDIETLRAVPPKDGRLKLGVKYAQGWDDYQGLGVACCCAVSTTGQPFVYDSGTLRDFQRVADYADRIVGHNIIGFDNKILAANGIIIPDAKCIDTLQLIERATGKKYGLDALCRKNFGAAKTMNGADAPEFWAEGRHAEVINYCLSDCWLALKLYRKIEKDGYILCPYTGQTIQVNLDT